ncbi:SET_domain-containing protein [Hexamita inflata]|uniref:SET domain-containing protein n=1 Tax=Hexamita inflata TaxID=28002 RepID=A0AA86TAA3_9EUKA|nr:SET domain-containing protein [Hexamita inflata]
MNSEENQTQLHVTQVTAHIQNLVENSTNLLANQNEISKYEKFFGFQYSSDIQTVNIGQIIKDAKKKYFVDTNNYFSSKIEVYDTVEMGKGVRATEDIKAGTCVIVEKAFLIAGEAVMKQMYDIKKKLPQYQQHVELLKQLYVPEPISAEVSEQDLSQLTKYNGYGEPDRLGNNIDLLDHLFLKISAVNHSCAANVTLRCYGDVGVVTARENIKSGDQIFICYKPVTFPLSSHSSILQQNFNFTCKCSLCSYLTSNSQQFDQIYNNFVQTLKSLKPSEYKTHLIPLVKSSVLNMNVDLKRQFVNSVIQTILLLRNRKLMERNENGAVLLLLIQMQIDSYLVKDQIIEYQSQLFKLLLTKSKMQTQTKDKKKLKDQAREIFVKYEAGGQSAFDALCAEYFENDDVSWVK